MSTTPAPCDLLIGNSDFYGKGIRVGIYLQWLSSWISVLVQPGTAQAILEVNAIFVFAIVIATITAYTTTGVHPIEIYIMLHFSFGFYLTILSTFGVRLQMLRSWSAAKLLRAIRDLPRAIRESAVIIGDVPSLAELFENHPGDSGPQIARRWLANYLSAVREITTMRSEIKLDFLKFVKMQSLAWSGVLWRSDIAGVLAGLNLAFWFGGDPGRAAPGDCVPVPQVFMFSRQPLRGPLLTFFRVGAVAAAVVVFLPATFLVILSFRLTTYLLLCISRDVFWRGRADSRRRAQASFDRLNQVLEAKTVEAMMARQLRAQMALPGSTALSWMLFSFRSWRDFVKFFLSSDVEDIHATDILKLCASLADADVRVAEDVPRDRRLAADEEDGTSGRGSRWASRCWNALTLCIIAWFILSIELTIKWNQITGVDTIQSTGQLIPLIIGVTSSAAAFQTLAVATIKKLYPDWNDMDLTATVDSEGSMTFQIRKKEADADGARPGQQDVGDGQHAQQIQVIT